jgi:hypothetical protein
MTDNLVPQYYRVSIAGAALAGSGDSTGFVDHKTAEEYGREGAYPSTLALARSKSRGNYRYKQMIWNLSENQSISNILDRVATGATADTPASTYAFTVVYDREKYVYTHNEVTDFGLLEGVDAVKRQIARTFANSYRINTEFPKDPLTTNNQGYEWLDEELIVNSPLAGDYAARIAAAEAVITVTHIPNTF